MKKLFIGIDDTLVFNHGGQTKPAVGLEDFLLFVTDYFDCHWLSSQCLGSYERVTDILQPFLGEDNECLSRIAITEFGRLKTEALPMDEDFIWIESRPLAAELAALDQAGRSHCFMRVDVQHKPGALMNCLCNLYAELKGDAGVDTGKLHAFLMKNFKFHRDDLRGFEWDIIIAGSDLLPDLEVQKTPDIDCILRCTGSFDPDLSIDEVTYRLTRLWKDDLRYRVFDRYVIERNEDQVILRFVTRGNACAVTGEIIANRGVP